MSHDTSTKRIYIGGTAQNPIGVSVDDVNTIIQEGSFDVGTLCRSDNINMWAKYKPVEYNSWGLTGKTSGSLYYKGNDGQCGLEIPKSNWNPVSDRAGFLSGGDTAWTRAKPTTKYRLLDFDGYNGNTSTPPTGTLTEAGQSSIAFDYGIPVFHVGLVTQSTLSQNDFLTVGDISLLDGNTQRALSDMYLRLLIVPVVGSQIFGSDGVLELVSNARVYNSSYSTTQLKELTMGELVDANSGFSSVTFTTYCEFELRPNTLPASNGIRPGDVYYTVYNNDRNYFQIHEITKSGGYITKLKCIRTSGTYFTPASGYLTKSSGSGANSIEYTDRTEDSYTFGSEQYYVLPVLYHSGGGVLCSLGYNPSVITLASLTNIVEVSDVTVTPYQSGGAKGFEVIVSVNNGFASQQTVDIEQIYLMYGSSTSDMYSFQASPYSDSGTVPSLGNAGITFTRTSSSLNNRTYTGIAFNVLGTRYTRIFDSNGEPVDGSDEPIV